MEQVQTSAAAPEWALLRGLCVRETLRILRRREDAEDAAQEALIRAWRHDAHRRSSTPVPWLLQISRNEAYRLAARRARLEPELSAGLLPEHSVEDPALARLPLTETVRGAVRQLPPADQLLLRLRYGEDLTQPQLAERLGQPEGTIKIRLHRVRRRLETMLTDAG